MAKLEVVTAERSQWERLILDYEAAAQARGLSFRTVEHYSDVLRRVLLRWCAEHELEPVNLAKRDLERLSVELQGRGLSRQSVRTYLAAINHFLAWCGREGEMTAVKAPTPKPERVLIDVLSRPEIDALEAAATTERDKLLVRVLADTGIRLGELRRLRVTDLVAQGRERYIRVQGKGARERLVPVMPGLYTRLERFVRRTRPESASEAMFTTLVRGKSGDYDPISEESVQHLFRSLGRKAGIAKRVYPHLLRHSYATHLLRKGVNPIQAKDILGHSSLAMLDRVYSHLAPADAYMAALRALQGSDDE